jgi:hypothetical protein
MATAGEPRARVSLIGEIAARCRALADDLDYLAEGELQPSPEVHAGLARLARATVFWAALTSQLGDA